MSNLTLELKKWRFLNNLSQSEVAEKIGCAQTTYSQYETGDRKRMPSECYLKLVELVSTSKYKINPDILVIENRNV